MLQSIESPGHIIKDKNISKIVTVFIVTLLLAIIELWGHYKSNSVSLLADSLHLFIDISGFVISIVAMFISKMKPNNRNTFGYKRAEIIGAIVSILFIWLIVVYLIAEAIHRYKIPKQINSHVFLIVAIIGMLCNILCLKILNDKSDKEEHGENNTMFSTCINSAHLHNTDNCTNINVKAAYIHVIGDLIQSVGVIIASVVLIIKPKWIVVDMITTILFTVFIFASTLPVIMEGVHILMNGTPDNIDIEELTKVVSTSNVPVHVKDIKCWSITTNSTAVIVSVVIDKKNIYEYDAIQYEIYEKVFNITSSKNIFIQIETSYSPEEDFTSVENSIPFI